MSRNREKRRVHEHEIEIAAAAKDLWKALTDAAEIARWMGWEAEHTEAWIDAALLRNVTASEPERYLLVGDRDAHFLEFFIESSAGRRACAWSTPGTSRERTGTGSTTARTSVGAGTWTTCATAWNGTPACRNARSTSVP